MLVTGEDPQPCIDKLDTFLKHQVASRQSTDDIAFVNAKAYLLKTRSCEETSLYELVVIDTFEAVGDV